MQKIRSGYPLLIVPAFLAIFLFAVAPSVAQNQDQDGLKELTEAEFALNVGKFDRAIQLLTTVISKKPNEAGLYLARAMAYSKKGDYDKSIQDLKQVTQMKSPEAVLEAYNVLGRIYEIKKDYASAQKAYQEALTRAKDPASKRALEQLIEEAGARLKKPK